MLSSGGVMPTASSIQKGYDIAAWAQANASRLGIMYIIYRQRIWDVRMASSGWVPMEDRGSITANHYDHVHISVFLDLNLERGTRKIRDDRVAACSCSTLSCCPASPP
jgi:hypothetical protein